MSLNPYASGEAALPATEVVPRAPKVAIASALLALASIACIVGPMAYGGYYVLVHGEAPGKHAADIAGYVVLGSIPLALIGLLLGIGALFMRRRPRVVGAIATFINGAIVFGGAALFYSVLHPNPVHN